MRGQTQAACSELCYAPGEAAGRTEGAYEGRETFPVAGIFGVEVSEGVLEPEAGEDSRSAVSRADDVKGIDAGLADETVDVGVDKREAGARSPVTEETGLDIVGSDIALDESVVLEEDHS